MLSRCNSLSSTKKVKEYLPAPKSVPKSIEARRHSSVPDWLKNDKKKDDLKKISEMMTYAQINRQQLNAVLTGCDRNEINVIIDARYDYEYRAGHIIGAFHVRTKVQLEKLYKKYATQSAHFVIYDDKSSMRSQIMISCLQRMAAVTFSNEGSKMIGDVDFSCLQDGFEDFITYYPDLCVGQNMSKTNPSFLQNGELKRCNTQFRREFNQRVPHLNLIPRLKRRTSSHETEELLVILSRGFDE